MRIEVLDKGNFSASKLTKILFLPPSEVSEISPITLAMRCHTNEYCAVIGYDVDTPPQIWYTNSELTGQDSEYDWNTLDF